MKLDFPRYTERLGAVSIHAIQRVYELDSGKSKGFHTSHQTVKKFDYDEISNTLHDLAIVIPIKGEKLKLLEGVLSGIPNECMVIIVSNSARAPVDRFAMEVDTVRQLERFMDKRIVMIHQHDIGLAETLKKVGYTSILDAQGGIRNGKAEAMVIGLLIAKMYHKDYVGFIDGDNYVPGAVNEYVKIFAAGFSMSTSPYCNVRISWVFKPKVRNNALQFAKWGRVSEITNRNLNSILSHVTGFETEIIKTGNAGEHALSMPLAESLHYSSGYSIEPYEFIDIFEKFGGINRSDYPDIMRKGIEIFQIETRNPHFHEDKGNSHLAEMLEASLLTIYNSTICPDDMKKNILQQIKEVGLKKEHADGSTSKATKRGSGRPSINGNQVILDPIKTVHMPEFTKLLRENTDTLCTYGSL